MKKHFVIILMLIACSYSSKTGPLRVVQYLKIFIDTTPVKNKNNIQKKLRSNSPFQGKRTFCSSDSDAKYLVTIKGNDVLIVIDNIKVKGVFKKDKLFTNDPAEIEYRKFAGKYNYGKYYVMGADYFSVLNPENGEYRYYTLCKQ